MKLNKITNYIFYFFIILVFGSNAYAQDTLSIDIQNKTGVKGSTVCIDVTARNFDSIESIQFNLSYDATLVVPQCPATNIHPGLQGSFFGEIFNCNSKDNGFLRFVWANNPTTIPDDAVLFSLCFELIGDPGNTSPVSINGNILDIEVCKAIGTKSDCKSPSTAKAGSITIVSNTFQLITNYCDAEPNKKGSFTFYGIGGNPPYSYTVNSGEFSGSGLQDGQRQTIADIPPKSYEVKITDSLGNMLSKTILLDSMGSGLKYNMVIENPTCTYLTKNGTIKLNTVPENFNTYSYQWSNLVSFRGIDTLGDLGVGTYFVTITNERTGCKVVDSTTLSRTPMGLSLDLLNPAACNQSGVFGSVEVKVTGGTPYQTSDPYEIVINRGSLNFRIPSTYVLNQKTGIYEITVKDTLGCAATGSIEIPFASTLEMTAVTQDITCKGTQSGSAIVTVNPYSKDFTFFGLNPISSNALGDPKRGDTLKLSNLPPGLYAFRALHSINSCRDTITFTITEPATALSLNPTIIQPGCNITGSIVLNTTGGSGGYIFSWDPPQNPNTTSLSNLTGGTYRISVTDSQNCIDTLTVVLNTQGALASNMAVTKHISCFGSNDAKLKATPSGGSGPYIYEWKNSQGQTLSQSDSLVNIGEGTYYLQVTDKDGCKSQLDSINLANPPTFTTIKSPTISPSCSNSLDGKVGINIFGGNLGYTFEWYTLGGTQILTRDSSFTGGAGVYVVYSKNSAGCQVSDTINMIAPTPILINASIVHPKCDTLGSITLLVSGGNPGYKYQWAQTSDTLNTIINLDEGIYHVTVTDQNNCTATLSQPINPSGRPLITVRSTDITCFGVQDGSLTVDIISQNGPFMISWRDSLGNNAGISQTIQNVSPGLYSVVVTDKNQCSSVMQTTRITQPDSIAYTTIVNNARCFQEKGSATINVLGGNDGYKFEWKNAAGLVIDNDSLLSMNAGQYTFVISNSQNCKKTDSIVITEPDKIVFPDPSKINVTCFGQSDGRAAIFSAPQNLNYVWSTGAIGTFALNLAKGAYWVFASDINNCISDTTFFNILEPSPVSLDKSMNITSDPKCFGQSNGSFFVTAQGGTGNSFSYSWDNGKIGNFQDNLAAGNYLVTITDGAGCKNIDSIQLGQPQELKTTKDLTNSKNPDCINITGGQVGFVINGGNVGQKIIQWQSGVASTTELATGLKSGIYCATITDMLGCQTNYCDTLTQTLKEVQLSSTITQQITCNGGNDGRIAVSINGNNAPFNISWKDSNGKEVSKDTLAQNLNADTYYIFVKELNIEGCQSYDTIVLSDPLKITFPRPETRKVTCFGLATGQATVVGGPSGLSYVWSTGETGQFATNFSAGQNWVFAKDGQSCTSDTIFFDIDTYEKLILDSTTTQLSNASCFGSTNGAVKVNAIGGTGLSYTYKWQHGAVGTELTNLAAGTYLVTISDSNNCTQSDSITILQPAELVATLDLSKSIELDCKGTEAGRLAIKTSGGNAGIKTISWQSGLTVDNGVAIGLKAGMYCATVTDNFGCKDTFCYDLKTPAQVTGEINQPDPPNCNGGTTCISVKNVSGGTGNRYTFQINNGRRFPIDSCVTVTAGQYFISFIDSAGCSIDTIVTINQPAPISVDVGPDIDMNLGQSAVLLKVDVVSEFRIDTVIWTPKSSLNCLTSDCITLEASPITTTTYLASVVDENGCKGSDELTVTVRNVRNVYFPNIFTPNRDGYNDYFQAIVGSGIQEVLSFVIYDRWGNLVFEKRNYIPDPTGTDGWDGTFNGVRLDPGVFVYMAKVRFIDGKEIQYSGSVTLADKVRN